MDDDQQILSKAIEWHEAGEELALATVISAWGASPRPVGSHMVVRSDGVFVGSVSGGCVETAVMSGALAAIDADKPSLLEFGVSAWRNGLSCGGRITVLGFPDRYPCGRDFGWSVCPRLPARAPAGDRGCRPYRRISGAHGGDDGVPIHGLRSPAGVRPARDLRA